MSEALQSLNSILKYKQERERQKIDRSLAMMDMATRLRQQQIDNARQERMMQLREADAKRDAKESVARLANYQLEYDKLEKSMSPEQSALKDEYKKAQIESLKLKTAKERDELIDKNVSNIRAAFDSSIMSSKEEFFKNNFINFGFRGLEDAIDASTSDGDFEEGQVNTVIKNYPKYVDNDAQKELLKYVTKNHRRLIPAMASIDIGGFKLAEDSIIEGLGLLYQDAQSNTKLQKLFENVGVNTELLNDSMIKLSNIIKREQTFNRMIESGELEKTAKRLAESQMGSDSGLSRLGLDILGIGNMSNDDIDQLNEQRIRDGLEPIPYEEFR